MKRLVGALAAVGLAAGHGIANAVDADDFAAVLGPAAVVSLVLWLFACVAGVIRGSEPESFSWKGRR